VVISLKTAKFGTRGNYNFSVVAAGRNYSQREGWSASTWAECHRLQLVSYGEGGRPISLALGFRAIFFEWLVLAAVSELQKRPYLASLNG